MNKKQNIIGKVKALLSKTVENGCSEAEALNAAEKVGQLMRDYDLSITEVEFNKGEFVTGEFLTKSSVQGHIHNIVYAIALFTDTKSWFTRKPVIKYSFFGSESDVRVAEFMCQFFLDTIETEIKLFKKSNTYKEESLTMPGKTLTTSFKHGICSRLGKRLVEMKDASKEKTNNEVGIVLFSKTAIVETKFKQLALRLKTSTSRTTTGSSSAFASGYVAGGKVSITTGKSVKSNQKQLS
jgi:hypothetical protein